MNRHLLLLAGVFVLAMLLRFYKLDEIPSSLDHDEIAIVYTGRFIIENGKDIYGNPWPLLYFNRFGDYPPVMPMYLAGLSTKIFGLNKFVVRLPTALFGALLIFPVFLLAKRLLYRNRYGIIAAFLTAVLPWHLTLSRISAEGIIGLSVFTGGLSVMIEGIFYKKKPVIIAGFIMISLSYLFYPSFRILTPFVLFALPFLIRSLSNNNKRFIVALSFLSVLMTIFIGTTVWGRGRYEQTSIFTSPQINMKAIKYIYGDIQTSLFTVRLFHNKAVYIIKEFFFQYLSYFSPAFLFYNLGLPPWYVVPDAGPLFYLLLFPLIAALVIRKNVHDGNMFRFCLYLLMISPLPAALTLDYTPNLHRSVFMIILLVLLATTGLAKIIAELDSRKTVKKIILTSAGFLLLIESGYFYHQYMNHMDAFASETKFDQHSELGQYLWEQNSRYKKIFVPDYGYLSIYYLYHKRDFSSGHIGKFALDYRIEKLDNLEFMNNGCPTEIFLKKEPPSNSLFVNKGDCPLTAGFIRLKEFIRPDNSIAFRLLTPLKQTKNN